MAKNCGCAGGACGCSIVAGSGIAISGVGSAVLPFEISRDQTFDNIEGQIVTDDSTSIEMTLLGAGTVLDPLIIGASVVLVSPNGGRWALAVSNTGVLTAVAL